MARAFPPLYSHKLNKKFFFDRHCRGGATSAPLESATGSYCVCDRFAIFMLIACFPLFYLSIESHFVGVHGPYELHRKEKQIECTALAVSGAFNLLFFPMQFIWPVNTDKMPFTILIFTSFNNKVCSDIAYFNTKTSYLSDSNV